jgi:hypothetical protein
MRREFQIIISNRSSTGGPPENRVAGFNRIKLFIAGLLMAVAGATVVTIIVVVGSILAAIVWITLVLTIVWLILKAAFRRVT